MFVSRHASFSILLCQALFRLLYITHPVLAVAEDAGVGMELETAQVRLEAQDKNGCTEQNHVDSIQKIIDKRRGQDWELTADMIQDKFLTAEYVFDGRTIKLGTGRLAEAAEEARSDFVSLLYLPSYL